MADIVKLIYKGDEMAQGGGGSSTPMATTNSLGTVRIAKNSEWETGDGQPGGIGTEYLVGTLEQIQTTEWINRLYSETTSSARTSEIYEAGASADLTWEVPADGFVVLSYKDWIKDGKGLVYISHGSGDGQVPEYGEFAGQPMVWPVGDEFVNTSNGPTLCINRRMIVPVRAGSLKLSIMIRSGEGYPSELPEGTTRLSITHYFRFKSKHRWSY